MSYTYSWPYAQFCASQEDAWLLTISFPHFSRFAEAIDLLISSNLPSSYSYPGGWTNATDIVLMFCSICLQFQKKFFWIFSSIVLTCRFLIAEVVPDSL